MLLILRITPRILNSVLLFPYLIPKTKILLRKLLFPHLVKILPKMFESKDLLSCSQTFPHFKLILFVIVINYIHQKSNTKGIKLQVIYIYIYFLCYLFRRICVIFRETKILRNLQKHKINKSKFTCNVILYISSIIT